MRMLKTEFGLHLIDLGEGFLTSSDWLLNPFLLYLLCLFLSNFGLLLGEFDLSSGDFGLSCLLLLLSEPLSLNCMLLLLNS